MNSQIESNNKCLHKTWQFIYDDNNILSKYPNGYYVNLNTKQKYSFEEGIKDIIGEDDEQKVYDQWWMINT